MKGMKPVLFSAICLLLTVSTTSAVDEIIDDVIPMSMTFPPTSTTTTPKPTDPPCGCSTPKPPPTFPCPPCVNGNCTPNMCNQAVQVPYPGDCTKFCKCDHGGAIGFECPAGLHFNPILQVCDWPQSAGCTIDNTYIGCESIKP